MADLDRDLETLYSREFLPREEVLRVLGLARTFFATQPNVVVVNAPVIVVGDVHGQFTDLMEIFDHVGRVPDTNFLFLGDYVDRGHHSVEVAQIVMVLKLRYPERVNLLRGNHESRSLTQVFGFADECLRKYPSFDSSVWTEFMSLFDYLPLAALIEDQILCVHGGLSPSVNTIDDIRTINRVIEVPTEGPMCDLMWSDPVQVNTGWGRSARGAGHTFGSDVTRKFRVANHLEMICRAHQVVMEGFHWAHDSTLVTLFSAPNYCYRHDNKGAILEVDDTLNVDTIQFEASPFSWNSKSREYDVRKRSKHRIPPVFLFGGTFFDDLDLLIEGEEGEELPNIEVTEVPEEDSSVGRDD